VLGSTQRRWTKNREPSSYPHGRRVGIGFDMSTLGLNSDMLASGSSSRRWRWVRGGIGFYISSLSSYRGSALDLLEPILLLWNPRH